MISTKGRYALRVMIDLAEHEAEGYIPLKDIAERQGISKKYLEIIMRDLLKGKMVSALSGKGGGYKLAKNQGDYSVGEILELMEGELVPVACMKKDFEPCSRKEYCKTLSLWKEYRETVHNFFYDKKLVDLVEEYQ